MKGALALVTGATGTIGRAVGAAVRGAEAVLRGGRDPGRAARPGKETGAGAVEAVRARVARSGRLDALTPGCGIHERSEDSGAPGRMAAANLLGPCALLWALLAFLVAARGRVVFLNSTQGRAASGGVGRFAATRHAMRAAAAGLREGVDDRGARVLSLFLGRAAGDRRRAVFALEGRPCPEGRPIQPGDVARAVLALLELPREAAATQLIPCPVQKA